MKRLFVMLAALGFLGSGTAQAFDWFGGRLSLGGGYGYDKPKLPYSFQNQYKEARLWTVQSMYFLNNNASVVVSYADLQAKSRTSASDMHFRPLVGSLRYNLFHNLPFTPYITGGVGVAFNRKEKTDGTESKWTQMTYQGGLGLEFFINEHTSIGAEGLYHHFVKKDRSYYGLPSAIAKMNLYFGDGPATRRAKEDAAAQRSRADAAQQQAAEANQRAMTSAQMAQAEQQKSQSQQAQMDAVAAQALAAKSEAERKLQEMEAQAAQGQAELDAIKQMIARKDLQAVNFRTGSVELMEPSHAALDKIAATAQKYPNLKLRVEGHTDAQGSDASNLTLSQGRADSVRAYLITAGVPAEQVVAAGFGESRPVATNETSDGRGLNRRVEFLFFLK